MRSANHFPLLMIVILVSGVMSALLDAVIGWEQLISLLIDRLAA